MGISVFMVCPDCWAFVPLDFRDPGIEGDVGEEWGEGAFTLSPRAVVEGFLSNADFFTPDEPYCDALKRVVRQFVHDHDHSTENGILFTTNYGFYMWEPGSEWPQADWWRYEEVVVNLKELPNEVPPTVWTFLPSHLVKHMQFTSFGDALNYLIACDHPIDSVESARELPYFRQLYEGFLQWADDPESGGKQPAKLPPPSSLIDLCLESLRRKKEVDALKSMNSIQLPEHLAQKVWRILRIRTDAEQREDDQEDDPVYCYVRYLALAEMFGRSLASVDITAALRSELDCNDHVINELLIRMASTPGSALDELKVVLADVDWEENKPVGMTGCALRTLTMVLVRTLHPQMKRWNLVGCGGLGDEFLLPLDDIDGDYVWHEMIDKDPDQPEKRGGLRLITMEPEAQGPVRDLVQRLREEARTNEALLKGPFGLEELDISGCYRLTANAVNQLGRVFPRLTRLHLNDLPFIPFLDASPEHAVLEHLVELGMQAVYYPHDVEQRKKKAKENGGEDYFTSLAKVCPRLEALDLAFWNVDDAELETIVKQMPHLRRLNVTSAKITDSGLMALGKCLQEGGRVMDKINLGGCTLITDLSGLARVRAIKAVGASGLGERESLLRGSEEGSPSALIEELDVRMVVRLKDEALLDALKRLPSLKSVNIYGNYSLRRETVLNAAKDFPSIRFITGGYYQEL